MPRFVVALCLVAALALAGGLAGCAGSKPETDLGAIYNNAAMVGEEHRSPVIVLPGILGSKLIDTDSGRRVWGAFTGDYANPNDDDDARLFALPMAEGTPIGALRDSIRSDGALDTIEVQFFGIPHTVDAYVQILGTLGLGGYRDRLLGESGAIQYGPGHYTCDQYDYDWRKDISQHADDLHDFVESVSEYIADERGLDEPVKVDIVAHSMGGLVARYYLRHGPVPLPDDGSLPPITWEGAKYVKRLIMVGTPNTGSALSLEQLVEGYRIAPILPEYHAGILGSFPSIYQLMPRTRHGAVVDRETGERLDIFDVRTWIDNEWGLADPDLDDDLAGLLPDAASPEARRRIALDHLRKSLARAEQFHRAMDRPASPPEGLDIVLIAGDSEDTPKVLEVDTRRGRLREAQSAPGDGIVLRTSALMDERVGRDWTPGLLSPIDFDQVTFLANNHLGLTRDPNFSNNVLFLLLEQRDRDELTPPAE